MVVSFTYIGLCFIDIMSYLMVIRSHDRKVAINYYYYYYIFKVTKKIKAKSIIPHEEC